MFKTDSSPIQYLASFAIAFAAGVIATHALRWHGEYMRNVGRREMYAKHKLEQNRVEQ